MGEPTDTVSCSTPPTELDSTGTSTLTRKTPSSTSSRDSPEEVSHSCQFTREDTSLDTSTKFLRPTPKSESRNIMVNTLSRRPPPGMPSRASADPFVHYYS